MTTACSPTAICRRSTTCLPISASPAFVCSNHDGRGDWLAFQSASYFRSAGELRQYGASARGITVNTVGPTPEEFPLFTPFWIEEPPDGSVIVCALMDGFSLAGAFRFVVRRETGRRDGRRGGALPAQGHRRSRRRAAHLHALVLGVCPPRRACRLAAGNP